MRQQHVAVVVHQQVVQGVLMGRGGGGGREAGSRGSNKEEEMVQGSLVGERRGCLQVAEEGDIEGQGGGGKA